MTPPVETITREQENVEMLWDLLVAIPLAIALLLVIVSHFIYYGMDLFPEDEELGAAK